MTMAYDRPEERFLEIVAKQLVTDIGVEKAFKFAEKVREQAKLESETKQPPVVSTRFLKIILALRQQQSEPIRVLQEDPKRDERQEET
jgi:hypothetical protein